MIYYKWFGLLYVACVLYMVSFSIGMASASMPWQNETLPPVGVGFAFFCQYTFVAIIGTFVPIIVAQYGVLPLCVTFTTICFLGFFMLDWLCVESKGKSPVTIINEYKNFKWKPL